MECEPESERGIYPDEAIEQIGSVNEKIVPSVKAPFEIDCERYSLVTKLLKVTAFCIRFVNKLRKTQVHTGALKSYELQQAETMWIQYIQRKCFSDVFYSKEVKRNTNHQRQLGLVVDESGIFRCKGRLVNADLTEAARQPILLPKGERFTYLLVEETHKDVLHSGVSQTLSSIRQRFWIPSGRATVRCVLRQCLTCRCHEG